MIKSVIKLALFLFCGVLAYNYFLGTDEEKQQSKETINTVGGATKKIASSVWGLLKSEKQKMDEGKYEGALDKVGDAVHSVGDLLGQLRETTKDLNDSGALDRLNELQQMQRDLENRVDNKSPESYDAQEEAEVQSDLQKLLKETEALMLDMEEQEQ